MDTESRKAEFSDDTEKKLKKTYIGEREGKIFERIFFKAFSNLIVFKAC